MPYPWPSFGSFLFEEGEAPIFGTDIGWGRSLKLSQESPLGSATDSIVALAVGSAMREFECLLPPSRFTQLEALLNTAALFTDWERPAPDSRSAYLRAVEPINRTVVVNCPDGSTLRRVRTRVSLVSQ